MTASLCSQGFTVIVRSVAPRYFSTLHRGCALCVGRWVRAPASHGRLDGPGWEQMEEVPLPSQAMRYI